MTISIFKHDDSIQIKTIDWLREQLPNELAIRAFAESTAQNAASVRAFMTAIDARINVSLIVSDDDYAIGIKSLFDVSLLDEPEATELLQLGGHNAAVILGA